MLAVTISNNTATFYGIFDSSDEMLAANEALDSLVKQKLDFGRYSIVPLPNSAEIALDDVVGLLAEDGDDPFELADDPETFYVQVSKYRLGTMECVAQYGEGC